MEKSQNKSFVVLRVIGIALLVIGLIIVIINVNKFVPSMGSDGWFEAESSKSFGLFGGGSLIMIGTVITAASFAPSFKRNATQNQDNIKFVGDADTQTTGKAEVRVKKCIYCGSEIQHDQVKCHSCGASRTAKK